MPLTLVRLRRHARTRKTGSTRNVRVVTPILHTRLRLRVQSVVVDGLRVRAVAHLAR